MFRLKKIFSSACVTLLLTFVLAVPGFALVSVDDVPYAYVQLNSDSPIYCTGSLPLWLSSSDVALTSYALYIPFTDVADSFDINLNLVSGAVTSYGTFSASYGTLQGSKYTQVGSLSSPVRKAAPQSTITSGKYKIGSFLSVDCSGVSSVPENCFIKVLCSGCNFTLYPSVSGDVGTLSSSYETIYWTTILGFQISSGDMTSFSSTGTTAGSNLVKPTGTTKGYINTKNETTSPVRLHTKARALSGEVASGVTFAISRSSDDSEAVAQLQQINGTLDGIADNMQTIVDDYRAKSDAGDSISGNTSDNDISSNSTSLSSGVASLDTFSSSATSNLDTLSSAGSGFSSLMALATPVILNIGPSSVGPLYIALLVIVAVMGLTFFIRRLL